MRFMIHKLSNSQNRDWGKRNNQQNRIKPQLSYNRLLHISILKAIQLTSKGFYDNYINSSINKKNDS